MLIQGISYPFQLSGGGLKLSSDADLVREGILSLIQTRLLEHVMRNFYGTEDFLFEASWDTTLSG